MGCILCFRMNLVHLHFYAWMRFVRSWTQFQFDASWNPLNLCFSLFLHWAYICMFMQIQGVAGGTCLLYVLTVSGVAFLLNLGSPLLYISSSNFPANDIIEVIVQTPTQIGKVTSVTATSGCLLVGRLDGSIGCYQLGKLDPEAPGFINNMLFISQCFHWLPSVSP